MEKTTFIKCSCASEGIEVWRDENETYLSFWYIGSCGPKLPFKQRLRHCWKVIRSGKPHPDDLVLDDDERKALVRALSDIALLIPGKRVGPSYRVDCTKCKASVELPIDQEHLDIAPMKGWTSPPVLCPAHSSETATITF